MYTEEHHPSLHDALPIYPHGIGLKKRTAAHAPRGVERQDHVLKAEGFRLRHVGPGPVFRRCNNRRCPWRSGARRSREARRGRENFADLRARWQKCKVLLTWSVNPVI